ncbi:MAG TPA: response regulator [Thermoanaerobaculia bacterium]|jgi:CheY-like chemotaxis protein|nr:response regulator [Thermoanaerobaculia bacterium]
MSQPGRVLVLEDIEQWRQVVSKALAGKGVVVDTAATAEQAYTLLAQNSYELLVLDISLVPGDIHDVGGLAFIERLRSEGRASGLQVIVLSDGNVISIARDAFVKYGAVDYWPKTEFDSDQFAQRVSSILSTRTKIDVNPINPDLVIRWQGVDDARAACLNLRIDGARRKIGDPVLDRAGGELESVLSRLFATAETILVEPMTRGKGGSGILRVQPFLATGAGLSAVVKFGDAKIVAREEQNFKRYVRPFLGGARSTSLDDAERRNLIGAIRYSLLGTMGEKFEDFGDFYAKHNVTAVCETLDNLFLKTCGPWYGNAGVLKLRDLGDEYRSLLGLSPDSLEEPLKRGLKAVQGKDELHFEALTSRRTFANPVPRLAARNFLRPTYACITHGDLNAENIFVDEAGSTWLIDFANTGPGHILRDFALLDVSIRVLLLAAGEAKLDERLALEEELLSRKRLGEFDMLSGRLATGNAALAKAHAAVVHLRHLAAEQVRRNPANDIDEYWIALLFYSLRLIRFWDLATVQREHALLSAALLAERLGS